MKKAVMALAAAALLVAAWRVWLSPVTVETCAPTRERFSDGVFGTGTLEAKNRVSISPHATGQVVKLYADQGDEIQKGELLAELFSDDIVQQLRIAEAELEVARETVRRTDAELVSAQTTLELAESDHTRAEALFQEEVETKSEYEKALGARDVARAACDQAAIRKREAELAVVRQEAQIEYWKTKLSETKLLAPFDGFVVRRNREAGAVVNPGVSIMDIADRSEIWASVWVDETRFADIRPGQRATIELRALKGKKFGGTVRRLARETDRETREHLVDIAPDGLPETWSLGERLEATIAVGPEEDRLAVPSATVRWKEGAPFLLVLRDGRIRRQPVRLGVRTPAKTEILDGLAGDDLVVCGGDDLLGRVGRRAKAAK